MCECALPYVEKHLFSGQWARGLLKGKRAGGGKRDRALGQHLQQGSAPLPCVGLFYYEVGGGTSAGIKYYVAPPQVPCGT